MNTVNPTGSQNATIFLIYLLEIKYTHHLQNSIKTACKHMLLAGASGCKYITDFMRD